VFHVEVSLKLLQGLVNGTDVSKLQLKFHRPPPYPFDFSMLIMWLLAVGCVAGGGTWAFFRHRAGKDITVVSTSPACSSQSSPSDSNAELRKKRIAFYSSFLAIAILMVILVGILMIGFFFRPVLVAFFNVMLVLFGSISVYGCIMALFSNCSLCECCSARLCAGIQHRWLPKGRPNILQLTVFICSFVLCLVWFLERRTPYAFILLDFINVTLCLHILKSLRLPNVMWITVLMICMFIYDAVMVFVTPYLTSNGCSVMLEVATGIGCSSDGNDGYPMPPVDAALPEKFPMLMQVPRFDPMISCVDLAIEKNFQMTILGLGDIIIPGKQHCSRETSVF
ncbi:signal peptide peptidase, partial [Oesophagostomum dentatum]